MTTIRQVYGAVRTALSQLPFPVWILHRNAARTRFLNPAFQSHWPESWERLRHDPRAFLEWVHPDDRLDVLWMVEDDEDGGAECTFRARASGSGYRTHTGRSLPLSVRGEVPSRYRLLLIMPGDRPGNEPAPGGPGCAQVLESLPVPLTLTDLEGRILVWNESATTLFGWEAGEVLGRRLDAFIQSLPKDPDALDPGPERPGFGEEWTGRARCQGRSGREFMATVRTRPIPREDGAPGVTSVLFTDPGPPEPLEDPPSPAVTFDALGRIAGGLVHDLNNLFTAIQGHLELATTEGGHYGSSELETIREAVDKGMSMTRPVLAALGRRKGEITTIPVNPAIQGVTRMFLPLLGTDVRLSTDLEPGGPAVRLAPGELEQLVMNLLLNAKHAVAGGGRIRVTSRTLSRTEPDGDGEDAEPSSWVEIQVEDDGVGMDQATLQRLFEPHFTTRAGRGGTGLGLATVQRIVSERGGRILVESAPGMGSRFRIRLPASTPVLEEPHPKDSVSPFPPDDEADGPEKPYVLVAEDDEAVRTVIHRVLEGEGFHVVSVGDGDGAQALLEEAPLPFHIVICDLVMPGVSGPELLNEVREGVPEARLIVISGLSAEEVTRRLPSHLYADAVLEKPFSPRELAETVRRVLPAADPSHGRSS